MTRIMAQSAVAPLLQAWNLGVTTPEGRDLFRDLNLVLDGDSVAVVGRNGVGKSTLLSVLSGQAEPTKGELRRDCSQVHVSRHIADRATRLALAELTQIGDVALSSSRVLGLPTLAKLRSSEQLSGGEKRKVMLLHAKLADPDLIFLDEPSEGLDDCGRTWLARWLQERRGFVVVSHDIALLRHFRHFFLVSESGCRYILGHYDEVIAQLQQEGDDEQKRYLSGLTRLAWQERHNALVSRRRRRKKMGGRVREIDKAPSRSMLNSKRSYAQESQGKRAKQQKRKIAAIRSLTKASRRALAVNLRVTALVPTLAPDDGEPSLTMRAVGGRFAHRELFSGIDLEVGRERVAVTGANGSGKTTLLRMMVGEIEPMEGAISRNTQRIGSIAQAGRNWMLDSSLLMTMLTTSRQPTLEACTERLVAHQFPLALATRPMRSLSPGERIRAALLCLFETSGMELLVLDEPTDGLDLLGTHMLRQILREWTGGLIIASHDHSLLDQLQIGRTLSLGQ